MRKFALLMAAAAMAVGGSAVKADFVVGHTRANNAVTIGGNAYDVVTWTVSNNGLNNTGNNLTSVEAAFVNPVSGMSIGIRSANRPDLFGTGNEPNKNLDSYLTATISGGGAGPGETVLNKSGGVYTSDTANGSVFTGSYGTTQQQLVAGIGGALLFLSPVDANPADSANFGAAVTFAQIVVPHGEPVTLLAPTDRVTNGVPLTYRPLGSGFGEDPNDPAGTAGHTAGALVPITASITDGTVPTPEPGSLAILGMVGAGLMARRRKA